MGKVGSLGSTVDSDKEVASEIISTSDRNRMGNNKRSSSCEGHLLFTKIIIY